MVLRVYTMTEAAKQRYTQAKRRRKEFQASTQSTNRSAATSHANHTTLISCSLCCSLFLVVTPYFRGNAADFRLAGGTGQHFRDVAPYRILDKLPSVRITKPKVAAGELAILRGARPRYRRGGSFFSQGG